MTWKDRMNRWLVNVPKTDPLYIELLQYQANEKRMEDSFYKDLEFGTGGMRGIIGPGTNRLNVYTVRKAAYGIARYIAEYGEEAKVRGLVIACDSRHMSFEFAREIAKTAGAQGIQIYLFEGIRPTPVLSFAVRYLNAFAGVMITASHNPPEYNGLKVYGEDGAQLTPVAADEVIGHIEEAGEPWNIKTATLDELEKDELLTYIRTNVDTAYIQALQSVQQQEGMTHDDLSIVYTALHGTGTKLMQAAFDTYGYTDVQYVIEQCFPDPDFSTVKSPNPEEADAFRLAIQHGAQRNTDILLATDPDADRLGVAVNDGKGGYALLTGNQAGALMLHYLLEQKASKGELPANGVMLKTIVTTELARAIADKYSVKTIDTLTGFKYIAERIEEFSKTGEHTFLFGFEESYGYLISDLVRDKDAIQAALLVSEAASTYKKQGKTLLDVLEGLYEEFGYYQEATKFITMEGKDGAEQIARIMDDFRHEPLTSVNGVVIVALDDYSIGARINQMTGERYSIGLPLTDAVKYWLEDGSSICIRPSGTEPKCKFYFQVKGKTELEAEQKLKSAVDSIFNRLEVKH